MNEHFRPTAPGLSRILPAALAGALVACGGLTQPVPTVAGIVEGWPAEAGTVQATLPARGDRPTVPLSQGAINAAGRFSLPLPDPASVEPFLGGPGTGECGSGLTVSPTGLRTVSLLVTVFNASGRAAGLIEQRTTVAVREGSRVVLRLYADRAGTVTGTCVGRGLNERLDLWLVWGWNTAVFEKTAGDTASLTSVAQPPADARWFLDPATVQALRFGLPGPGR